jgi:hypothetical protein
VRMVMINPEDREVHAIADTVCAYTLRHLHNSAQTKRA